MSTSKVQPGWTRPESPIHEGERTCRGASASRERWTAWEGRFIRAYMPDQHRRFFEKIPFVFTGLVDHSGQPGASMLVGHPGFIRPHAHAYKTIFCRRW